MRQNFSIELPEGLDEPHKTLREFFVHNGYSVVKDNDDWPLSLKRGKAGAGWWSSNMTDLLTELNIERNGETLDVTYHVDTTGQLMSDEDRAFWPSEVRAAERYLHGKGELVDLRDGEAKRVKKLEREHLRIGMWGAAIVFVFVFGFVLVVNRFSLL